jgi:hypothetical protein
MRKQSARQPERYISIVSEANHREVRHVLNAIGNRVALMEARGYSKKQQNAYVFKVLRDLETGRMNEGVLDSLGELVKWASEKKYLQPIQSWIGTKLAGILGLKPGTMMHRVVVNFVENLEVSKLQQMFSGNLCRPLVSELAGAVQEALVEEIADNTGIAGESWFGKAVQETLQAAFVEEGPFVEKVTNVICSLDISDLMPGGKKDVKAAISGAAPAAPAAPAV